MTIPRLRGGSDWSDVRQPWFRSCLRIPDLGFSSGCRIEEVEELLCMKIVDEVQLPWGSSRRG